MERAQNGAMNVIDRRGGFTGNQRPAPPRRAEIHVWAWNLAVDAHSLAELEGPLSDDEWRRVQRFRSHLHARRFVARRGAVRRILGNYLDLPAHEIRFVYGPQAKPALASGLSKELEFNLADSCDLAVLAVGSGHPIGVDVELLRPIPESGALAAQAFTARELEELERAAESQQARIFLQLWTRGEAVAKAEGCGLRFAADILAEPDLATRHRPGQNTIQASVSDKWRICPLPLRAGYVGALATSQAVEEIIRYSYSSDFPPDSDSLSAFNPIV